MLSVPVRIGLVAPHIEHAISGEETSIRALEEGLRAAGHDVSLHLPPLGPAAGGGERPFRRFRTIERLLSGLSADPDPPDLYHVFLPTAGVAWTAAPLARLARPWLLTFEGRLVGEEWPALLRLLPAHASYALARLALNTRPVASIRRPAAAAYVVPTAWQRDELVTCGYPAERIHVVPNLVRNGPTALPAADEARARLGLPGRRLVLYVGHFLPSKGVPDLVEIFADLCADFPDVDLALAWSHVGDGSDVEAAVTRRGIAHRVRILGPVDPAAAFAAADVVVLPYRTTHGHSMIPATILEAMSAGRPVLLPDHPVFDSVRAGVATFPLRDRGGLGRALRALLSDSAAREALGRRAAALFRESFAADRLLPRYLSLYDGVLSGR